MGDPAPLAHVVNASVRRNLLSSLLGPPSRAAADPAEADHQAELCQFSTVLLREERQDLNNVWKEMTEESAGVGIVATSDKQDDRMPKPIGSNQRDSELLKKQLLGRASKSRHTGSPHQAPNARLDSRNQYAETKNRDDEISSEEEQGRSGLGKSSKQYSTNKLERPNKKAKIEVETFESMQYEGSENYAQAKEEIESVAIPPAKRTSGKPKSYLDQILEAKRSKQQKAKMKKERKLNPDTGQ